MRKIIVLAFIVCCSDSINSGEIVQYELPGLLGTYTEEGITSRSTDFQFDRMPDTIYSVKLMLAGVLAQGTQFCDFGGINAPLGMNFTSTVPDTISDGIWNVDYDIEGHSHDWNDIEFDSTLSFISKNDETWEFLEAESGIVVIHASNMPLAIYNHCGVLDDPSCEIVSAAIIIDADFQVGIESLSWGAIKSLLR